MFLPILTISMMFLTFALDSSHLYHCYFLQGLAAFLKAIGYLIPLMDPEYANYYTREVMLILIREFQSPDEEMKKIVLKVSLSCSLSSTPILDSTLNGGSD